MGEGWKLRPLRKLSLCSGIGGDDLASEWAGIQTLAFCERDKYCQQVLHKHWPGIPIIEDVRDVETETVRNAICQSRQEAAEDGLDMERHVLQQGKWDEGSDRVNQSSSQWIDIISAGFPCQPHSVAGRRRGALDERNLWPAIRRILGEIRPRWFVGENVPGLFSSDNGHFFGGILFDLASLGYDVGWCCYGANDVGAWHKRDRVFILVHAKQFRCTQRSPTGQRGDGGLEGQISKRQTNGLPAECGIICTPSITGLADWAGGTVGMPRPLTEFERLGGREIERDFRGMAHGVSRRVDRLRALGNAVVPQQIYPIYKAIVEYERGRSVANE